MTVTEAPQAEFSPAKADTADNVGAAAVGGLVLRHAPTGSVLAAVSYWATYFVWGTGGRDPHVLSIACGLLLVAVLLVRPWRHVPTTAWLLGNAIGVAAFVVALTAPTGWAGANDAASYAYSSQLGLVLLAWASTPSRRTLLLGTVVTAGGLEFAQGWLPWWGSQDTTKLFQGTFYWHNQAGMFLAAGALASFGVVSRQIRPWSALGWFAGPLSAAGVLFTTSRGSEMALTLGVGALLCTSLGAGAAKRLLRLAGVLASSAVVSLALAGPPFFPHRLSPIAGTAARGASLEGNGVQRLEDWRRALAIFRHWPVTGAGFHSFSSATSVATTRHDKVTTAFAHNGFLQALSDGGLVLSLPLFLALGLTLILAARSLPAAIRGGDVLLPVALSLWLPLLLHSGMDFDWSYPALLSLTAVVGVLCLPLATIRVARPTAMTSLKVVVPVVLLATSIVAAWHGGLSLNTSIGSSR